jgi:DNA-binding MarR family transcriptional regulator
LLKFSHTKDMAAEETDVTSELARNAGELRVRMARLARRLRREDRGHALTMSQLTALGRLDRQGAATLSELAAGERVRPQSMARTIDALETTGMVRRAPHPADRRQNLIKLTGAGRAMVTENRLRRDTWLARAMAAALSPEERDLLVRAGGLMERLADLAGEAGPEGV